MIVPETYRPIGEWDVSNVMGDGHARFFFSAKPFDDDISKWDVSY